MPQPLLPRPPNLFHSPFKTIVSSNSQLKQLSIKRSCPSAIEFNLEDASEIKNSTFRDLIRFLSKRVMKLKNPPLNETLKNVRLAKHLRRLEVKPLDIAKYITMITRRFSKLTHLAITDESDVFSPIRVKGKVSPMRSLKSFTYNHEFCKDFIKCARYVSTLKIRKICVDFAQLRRFQRLENAYIILKTKYLTLPDEDKACISKLGNILLNLPLVKRVVLDHEIDAENYPFMFLDLVETLKDKAKVNLVADFVDVSNQRNKNASLEGMIQALSESGIKSLYVNYVGVMKAVKRFGRTFYAPIHVKKELYLRFMKAMLDNSFDEINFTPTVHSSYIDEELRNSFLQLAKSDSKTKIRGLTVEYHLDLIEPNSLGLLLDLYTCNVPSYEIIITGTPVLLKSLPEQLESHFSSVFDKLKLLKAELSLRISARNLTMLASTIQNTLSKADFSFLKGLIIQITEPIGNSSLENIVQLLNKSYLCNNIQSLELDIAQKEAPSSKEIFDLFSKLAEKCLKVKNMSLSYFNASEYRTTIKNTIEKLRSQHSRTNFLYEVNRERVDFD